MADSEASKWNSGARKVTTCTSTLSIACTSPSDAAAAASSSSLRFLLPDILWLFLSQRCAGRSVSVAALLPMREHRAGPVSRAAVALASAFSVLGDCLRVDQKTRRPTARPVARFGPHLSCSLGRVRE